MHTSKKLKKKKLAASCGIPPPPKWIHGAEVKQKEIDWLSLEDPGSHPEVILWARRVHVLPPNNNSYSSRTCRLPQVTSQDPLLFPFNKTAILYNVSPAEGTRRTGLSRDSRQKDRRNTTPPMYDLGRGLLRQKSPGKKEPWMPLIVTLFPSLPLFPPAAKQHSADKRFFFGVGSGNLTR